ncbi:MAG: hypothetical protein KatS3mg105_2364 [Gemmatales bacterium]|nr:MAG: hypothetical protein KatS3mg105_2364 [Gemmatales bacterium]
MSKWRQMDNPRAVQESAWATSAFAEQSCVETGFLTQSSAGHLERVCKGVRSRESKNFRFLWAQPLSSLSLLPLLFTTAGNYAHSKRLRVVDPGKLYRAGQMNAAGLAAAVRRYGIRTVLNLQNESPDPDVPTDFVGSSTIKESQLCRELGVNYRYLEVDLLPPARAETESPKAIAEFLKIMDDPKKLSCLDSLPGRFAPDGSLMRSLSDGVQRLESITWRFGKCWTTASAEKRAIVATNTSASICSITSPRWLTGQAEKNGPSRIAQSGQDR